MSSSQSQMSAGHEGPSSAALLPSEVLERAAALIEPEGAWTKYQNAADRDGYYAPPCDPRAVCWCARGAVARVGGYEDRSRVHEWFYRANGMGFVRFNDAALRTQRQVVAALRKAAELAKAEGK